MLPLPPNLRPTVGDTSKGLYRNGTCSGTTNGFTCEAQPVCAPGQFLNGSTATTRGVCSSCSNALCGADQYRAGTCAGTDDGYECKDRPTCADEQYLAGVDGTDPTAMGSCKSCSFTTCG